MNYIEIKVSDITAPKLREDQKINLGQSVNSISNLSPDEFESFISEWLKFCKYSNRSDYQIYKVGGSGDEGIDILIRNPMGYDVIQCKRHSNKLNYPDFRRIIIKILWYSFIDSEPYPNSIQIATIHGVNGVVYKKLGSLENFKTDLVSNVCSDLNYVSIRYEKKAIEEFKRYVSGFSLTNLSVLNIEEIVKEYSLSDMASFRFQNKRVRVPRIELEKNKGHNMLFLETIMGLLKDEKESFIERVVNDAKVEFFSALELEATCRYLFGEETEFDKIKANIQVNVNNELLRKHKTNRERFIAAREKSYSTDVSNSYLDFELHMVSNPDKSGTCFILTNEGLINWND